MTNIRSTTSIVNGWLALGETQATYNYDNRGWVAPPLTPPTTINVTGKPMGHMGG